MFLHFHPFAPYIKKDTKKLIMGTLPPPRFCVSEYKKEDVIFPYGSADGLLWRVLDKIFDLNLEFNQGQKAISQRKEFLNSSQIGICDIVDSCKREKVDASDLGMREVELRDILGYLKEFKTIDTIVFTGGASKNGPEYFLRQILKKEKIKFELVSKEVPKVHQFYYDKRFIKTISLTSPSPAANRYIGSNEVYKKRKLEDKNYSTFDFRVEQYKKVFM